VLHDFDISGFSIRQTIGSDTRRYTFQNQIEVHDLGLRFADVEHLGLESEAVAIDKNPAMLRRWLQINGATNEEIAFLLSGRRVELNAMTSDQFVAFIEDKLEEHGVVKVVPNQAQLNDAYQLFKRSEQVKGIVEKILADQGELQTTAPADLEQRVREYLDEHPEETWDDAVAVIAREKKS
jgi:hypothetical protein